MLGSSGENTTGTGPVQLSVGMTASGGGSGLSIYGITRYARPRMKRRSAFMPGSEMRPPTWITLCL